jgi:hypothetical protein
MTTTIEELQAIVAQSVLDTQAFKAQLAASQEAADRRADKRVAEAASDAAEARAICGEGVLMESQNCFIGSVYIFCCFIPPKPLCVFTPLDKGRAATFSTAG